MKKVNIRMLVEAGVLIALAQVLSYVKLFEAPQGGSVTLGSMIPVVIFAVRWGFKPGVAAGVAYGILQFVLGGEIFSANPLSILLDYITAFGALGLAGLFRNSLPGIMAGTFFAILGRFVSHFLSGILIWADYAPKGMNPAVYSIIYNGGYLFPELVITMVLTLLLYSALKKRGIIQNLAQQ